MAKQAPSGKAVLVCFGDNRRVFTISSTLQGTLSERESLLALCRFEFRDLMPADTCTLTLQVKDEDWGGMYIDYTKSHVDDRSTFQLVAVPRVVSLFIINAQSLFIKKYLVQAKLCSPSTSHSQDSVVCSPVESASVSCKPVVRPRVRIWYILKHVCVHWKLFGEILIWLYLILCHFSKFGCVILIVLDKLWFVYALGEIFKLPLMCMAASLDVIVQVSACSPHLAYTGNIRA